MTLEVGPELAKIVKGTGLVLLLLGLAYTGLVAAVWVMHG
jgi:hypothetical protein